MLETVAANKMDACYIRPIVYRGYGQLGVNPFPCPVDVAIMVWDWGSYLGTEALEKGVDVCVSSWTRIAPNTLPAMAKTAANYMNSQLIKMEAIKDGYVEGIALDADGYLSEGSGENLFLVKNGHAPHAAARLLGPARHHARHRVHARPAPAASRWRRRACPARCSTSRTRCSSPAPPPRSRPIRSVDKITIGKGVRGPGHGGAAEGVLRRDRVPGARRVRLAHVRARGRRGGRRLAAPARLRRAARLRRGACTSTIS